MILNGSEHNHTTIHSGQLSRMHKLLRILEIEQEKLNPESQEKWRFDRSLPSIFNEYTSTNLRKDLPPDFRGIFKAMNRLADDFVCSKCKKTFVKIIQSNAESLKK